MKQAKAYINLSLNRNLSTANYVGVEEAIRQAQKDAYRQALVDMEYEWANSDCEDAFDAFSEAINKLRKQ